MKYTLTIIIISLCVFLNAQDFTHINFDSEYLGSSRSIRISTPSDSSKVKFPSIYLIGAQKNDFRTSILQDEFITIGIESKDFKSDFLTENNREKYLRFLTEELIPFIEKSYSVSTTRFISGHSLAGAMVLDAFLLSPDAFTFYFATSPTLHIVNTNAIAQAHYHNFKALYFNIGRNENYPQLEEANHAFHFKLDSLKPEKLQWKFEVMKDETHETNEYTGFCRSYSFYRSLSSVPDSIIGQTINNIINYASGIKQTYGLQVNIDENVMMSNILINLGEKSYLNVKSTLEYMANNQPKLFADQIDIILEITDAIKNNGEEALALELYRFIVAKTDDPIAKIMVHDMTRKKD